LPIIRIELAKIDRHVDNADMRIEKQIKDNEITGYSMQLVAEDMDNWAHKAGANWPCSQLAGHELIIVVDDNGLCDLTLDGKPVDIDGAELEACVRDHLPKEYQHLWPIWSNRVV
jgi:hypothetical protein